MKILCIGSATYDVTVPMEGFPIENTKNRVEKRVECGGGPASTAAYLLGKWGMKVYFAGAVGNDELGENIKDEFKEVKVDTRYLKVIRKHKTSNSFIIANKTTGSRTVLNYREPEVKLGKINISVKPDIILVDGQEYELSKEVISKNKKAISVIDAGRAVPEVIELAKMVNYLVCSKEFAESVTEMKFDFNDLSSLSRIYQKMKEIFQNEIIITLESRGCLYETERDLKIMPSIEVKSIDSTGAGDIFHGAFVYGLAKGFKLEKILKIANVAGALSVTRLGGRNSVFSKKEMKEHLSDFE